MNEKINAYKAIAIVTSVVCVFVAVSIFFDAEYPVGTKIFVGISAFVAIFAVQAIYYTKVGSLKCPKCQKPVMTKSSPLDQQQVSLKAYEKCYFCGHRY